MAMLIETLCPNGVAWVPLGDICTFVNGKAFKPADWSSSGMKIIRIQNLNDSNAEYNFYSGEVEEKYLVHDGDLLFSWSGTPGTSFGAFIWQGETSVLNQHIFNVKIDECVDKSFLKYSIDKNMQRIIDKAHGGAGLRHITKAELEQITIQLPPLPVQQEIVRILDTFTAMNANLEEELAARRKQFDHYITKLIRNDTTSKRVPLGQMVSVQMCKRIKKEQTEPNGDIPFYKNGTLGKQADAYIPYSLYIDFKNKYNYPLVGEVMLTTAGTVGQTIQYDGVPAYFQDSNVVWLHNDEKRVLNSYLFWVCRSFPWKIPSRATIKHLHNDMIRETEIPVPSITEQLRIVGVLSALDALCGTASGNLREEQQQRMKQYEYYRDKLLTFKEA